MSTFLRGGVQFLPYLLLITCLISSTLVTLQAAEVFENIGLNLEGTGSPGDQMLLIFSWSRSLLTKNW